MGYVIQRRDGTTDGLGDRVVFETESEAWDAARAAFGRDPASDYGGVESWLRVVDAPACQAPLDDGDPVVAALSGLAGRLCGYPATEERTVEGIVLHLCAEHARELDEEGDSGQEG